MAPAACIRPTLKRAIGDELAKIVAPIRDRLTLSDETAEAIRGSSQ